MVLKGKGRWRRKLGQKEMDFMFGVSSRTGGSEACLRCWGHRHSI